MNINLAKNLIWNFVFMPLQDPITSVIALSTRYTVWSSVWTSIGYCSGVSLLNFTWNIIWNKINEN